MKSLASAAVLSIRHVRNKLQTLPITLVATYDEAMQRITSQDSEHRDIAFKTLAWISYAFRSLSLRELQHALAIEPEDPELDEELIMDGRSITALCAGLVTIDPGTDAVNLVHYTAKKYFEDKREVYFPGFHGNITLSCATYLAMPALHNATIWAIVQHFPLACYAAQYMGDHARQNPEEALEVSILEAVYQLLASSSKRKPLLALLDSLDLIRSGFYSSREPPPLEFNVASRSNKGLLDETVVEHAGDQPSRMLEVTALHLAASMGLAKVASLLLKENPNIDAVDETGKTALAVAIDRGFEKAVEFLVNSGAHVDLRTYHGQQVFLLVTEKRWHTVAHIIANRAKATAGEKDLDVHLLVAAYSGDVPEVRRLLAQEADTKNPSVKALALFLAVERADSDMVQMLSSSMVDINSRDSTGQASLHRATRQGSQNIMRILLNNGAEVDLKNDEGRTAWSANVNSKNDHILSILLKAGADPNTRGHEGVSELYLASSGGHTDLVRFMLKSGTNPSITTDYAWAPLHWAANGGYIGCVSLLIEAGADINAFSDQGTTPLDLAISNSQVSTTDLLLRAGAKESKEISAGISVTATTKSESTQVLPEVLKTTAALTLTDTEEVEHQTKLTFLFDRPMNQSLEWGQFVYRTDRHMATCDVINQPGETRQCYQISHMLDNPIQSISVRRTYFRPDMAEYPLPTEIFVRNDVLYDITRVTMNHQELELRSNSASPLLGTIKMRRGWSGGWKAHHDQEGCPVLLFRTTPDWSQSEDSGSRWTTEDGQLIARTGGKLEHTLSVEHGLDFKLLEVLVTCWIAKLWYETLTKQKGKEVNST